MTCCDTYHAIRYQQCPLLCKNSLMWQKHAIARNNRINHSHSPKITIKSIISIIRQIKG